MSVSVGEGRGVACSSHQCPFCTRTGTTGITPETDAAAKKGEVYRNQIKGFFVGRSSEYGFLILRFRCPLPIILSAMQLRSSTTMSSLLTLEEGHAFPCHHAGSL